MPRNATVREKLIAAQNGKVIVQFARPFESGTMTGFIINVGPQFFLFASLGDDFAFEQHIILRIKDVRRLQAPAKNATFYQKVRKIRGDKMPPKLKLNLADIDSIVRSAAPSLLTIYRESHDSGVCHIGYATSGDERTLEMIEIAPDATWDPNPTYYRLKHITRIDLPGRYEKALQLVGGLPDRPHEKDTR